MKVQVFERLPEELARRFEKFEASFTYPLGDNLRFSIEHGPDYGLFYRSLGDPLCVVAEDGNAIAGTVSIALRSLVVKGRKQCAWYVGDLKIGQRWRGGEPLRGIALASFRSAAPRCARAFGVMMDGAVKRPDKLGRRTSIPLFSRTGEVHLWSIPTAKARGADALEIDETEGEARFFQMVGADTVIASGGDPRAKSKFPVAWLTTPSGTAVGRLEDTHRAKRLVRNDGVPLPLAHLACFAYADAESAMSLLDSAMGLARGRGFETLMVSMPPVRSRELSERLQAAQASLATATVFGVRTEHCSEWHINSSEI
jgi:hypothetical protein